MHYYVGSQTWMKLPGSVKETFLVNNPTSYPYDSGHSGVYLRQTLLCKYAKVNPLSPKFGIPDIPPPVNPTMEGGNIQLCTEQNQKKEYF